MECTTVSSKSSTETGRLCSKRLFTSYRLDQYNDPVSFAEQVAIIFAGYEDAVLIRATDPSRRDSLQRQFKWPPALAEISAALDVFEKLIAAQAYVAERESRGFHRDTTKGFGFFNANGERYDPQRHRDLPQIEAPR